MLCCHQSLDLPHKFHLYLIKSSTLKMQIWRSGFGAWTQTVNCPYWPSIIGIMWCVLSNQTKVYLKYKTECNFCQNAQFWRVVVIIVIVLLLLPTLFGKRGILTRSPLLWVFETLSDSVLSYKQDWHWRQCGKNPSFSMLKGN